MDGPVETPGDIPVGTSGDVVSLTALAVASGRAVESSRPDALVHDPFAAPLVESLLASTEIDLPTSWPEPDEVLTPRRRQLLLASAYIGLRTRFIDDYLAGVRPDADPVPEVDLPRQVVILGAGLDTRAFRRDWPGRTEIFELDRPEVLLHKRDVLREMGAGPRCEWFAVPTDLGHTWDYSLIAAGFDRRRRTAWIVEGVLPYLAAEDQREVITTIARLSAPGSRAVIERAVTLVDAPELEEKLRVFAAETGLPMDGLLARVNPPDPAEILGERGWAVQEHTVAELAERYGRDLTSTAVLSSGSDPDATDAAGTERDAPAIGGFLTADLDPRVG